MICAGNAGKHKPKTRTLLARLPVTQTNMADAAYYTKAGQAACYANHHQSLPVTQTTMPILPVTQTTMPILPVTQATVLVLSGRRTRKRRGWRGGGGALEGQGSIGGGRLCSRVPPAA